MQQIFKLPIEFDIKGLFDNIRHDYLMEMVKRHTKEEWILLYIQRWLVAPFQMEDGTVVPRTSGMRKTFGFDERL